MTSFMDDMMALAREFTESDFLTTATITRKTTGGFDPIAGRSTDASHTIICRAVAAHKSVMNDAGAIVEKTLLTVNSPIVSGDKITIGSDDYTVGEVMTIAPHGEAFLWKTIAK